MNHIVGPDDTMVIMKETYEQLHRKFKRSNKWIHQLGYADKKRGCGGFQQNNLSGRYLTSQSYSNSLCVQRYNYELRGYV